MQARTTAPASAAVTEPDVMRANMNTGKAMAAAHSTSSVVRRPILSESAPANGVTAITVTEATVDSHKELPSGKPETEVRKVGT